MRWIDSLALASRCLRRRPARTLLTVLAVTLGATLLVALGSVASTAGSRIVSKLSNGGPGTAIRVAASQADSDQIYIDDLHAVGPKPITEATLNSMRRSPHVATVIPVMAARILAVPPPFGSTAASTPGLAAFPDTMVGVDMNQAGNLPITILAGRLPRPGSLTEAAVTESYLDHSGMIVTSTLGTQVEIAEPQAFRTADSLNFRARWVRAEIVGVITQQVGSGTLLVPIEQARLARQWALEGVDGGDVFPLPTSPYTGMVVLSSSLNDLHAARQVVTNLGYANSAPEHLVASVLRYLRVVDIVLAGIGAIALGIAGLGVANALLAAVRERRREIGVLKAIGARDRDILRWFLLEALAVGSVGGVIGTVVGLLIALWVGVSVNTYLAEQGVQSIQFGDVSWPLIAAAILGTSLLSIAAGIVPALKAARLTPREAVAAA
ncbi:MAG TPA: ABC transporter permease [Candidatus Dormibacteraeota bacterium]|nr:ABC transporter permease [Candidatus Dormibacteraeota bacterium]